MSSSAKFATLRPVHYHPYTKHNVYSSVAAVPEKLVDLTNMPALNLPSIDDVSPVTAVAGSPLDLPQVRIRDRDSVERKLKQMNAGGADKLMIITDFDQTLSRFEDTQGNKCWTTHGVFDNFAHEVDPTLGAKFTALKEKYYPIEYDHTLTLEEKVPHMEAWWKTSHGHIQEAGFTKSTIERFVANSKISFRDGVVPMVHRLEDSRVPLVVFSAGIGNIIEIFFTQTFGRPLSNAHLISNMMQFDNEDKVCGFSEPLIHTFCKNSSVIRKEAGFFHSVNGRTNVILLGDSMGDIHMNVGVENASSTLKIGFLNNDVERLLDHYMDIYDIVLVRDSTVDVPSRIIDAITASC